LQKRGVEESEAEAVRETTKRTLRNIRHIDSPSWRTLSLRKDKTNYVDLDGRRVNSIDRVQIEQPFDDPVISVANGEMTLLSKSDKQLFDFDTTATETGVYVEFSVPMDCVVDNDNRTILCKRRR